MYDLKTFGQMNLDLIFSGFPRIPDLGEEVFAESFDISLGGGPMTYPIVLDKLGCSVRLGTFLTDNMVSDLCRGLLRRRSFDAYESFDSGTTEPVVVTSVLSEPKDRRFVAFNQGVNESLLPAQTVYDFLRDARIASAPVGHPEVTRALSEEGVRIVYDVGWMECRPLEDMASFLKYVSVFTPNEKEALHITQAKDVETALRMLADYTACPIITRGDSGAIYYRDGVRVMPKLPGSICVDTTGAGDNFLSGVIYGLCKGASIDSCVRYGNIFAGISVSQLGCFGAAITEEEIAAGQEAFAELVPML